MGRKKKYSDGVRAQFIAKIAAGEDVHRAAAAVGVPFSSAEKWARAYNKGLDAGNPIVSQESSPPTPGDTSPGLEAGKVETPGPGSAGSAGGAGAGGAEAAARAAGLAGGPSTASDRTPIDPSARVSHPEPPPMDSGKALVMLTEFAVSGTMRAYCLKFEIPYDDDAQTIAELTPKERQKLEEYAPYAAPFMGELLEKYGKYIGAGLYVFMVHGVLSDRVRYVKTRAKKEHPDRYEEVKAGPAPAPSRDHQFPNGARESDFKAPAARRAPIGGVSEKDNLNDLWKQMERGQMPVAAPARRDTA
jgi:hypothetical protein